MKSVAEIAATETYPTITDTSKQAVAYHRAALQLRETLEPLAVEMVRVQIKTLVGDGAGGWTLRDRGTLVRPATFKTQRPGRYAPIRETDAQAILDSFFDRGDAWKRLRDEQVSQALLRWANDQGHLLDSESARIVSQAVCLALCARAGVVVEGYELFDTEGGS
jgi:hypothetical protein